MTTGLGSRRPDLAAAFIAAGIAMLVAAPSLVNDFAYDDHPIVRLNARVFEPHSFWWHLQQGYWPNLAYRPLTVWLFSLQWRAGGGSPFLFHLINVLLLGLVTALIYRFARAYLATAPAFLVSLLFAVHPVHVETVANVVGQAELWAALGVLAALILFLDAEAAGAGPVRRVVIALIGAAAALAKEHAFVLPALLGLTALTAAPERPLRARIRAVAPTFWFTAGVLAGVFAWRAVVLGDGVGVEPALALRGLSPWERVLTMLAVIPHVVRLLFWPAHLQAEYGPPVLDAAHTFGADQLAGLLVLVLLSSVAWLARTRAPAVTCGLSWIWIAWFPVSNIAAPTGILLAERTLFLPSVGAVIALGGAGLLLLERLRHPAWHYALVTAALIAAVGGGWRSVKRAPVWRDNQTLFRAGVVDAPRSYRAWRMLGLELYGQGRWDAAEAALDRSLRLWKRDPSVHEAMGLTLVQQGRCADAVPVLRAGLALDSARPYGRARLYFCETKIGDWENALLTAQGGVAVGDTSFARLVRQADSALRQRATVGASAPERR